MSVRHVALLPLLCLLAVGCMEAEAWDDMHIMFIQGTSGGAAGPTSCAGCLISENFDGSTACGDGSHSNCDLEWDGVSNTPDFDSGGLDGTYACTFVESEVIYEGIANADDVYGYFIINATTLPSNDRRIIKLANSSGIMKGQIDLDGAGTLTMYHGASTCTTTDSLSVSTDYHVWYGHEKGTGADGVYYIGFSTSADSKPSNGNKYCSGADGASSDAIQRLYIDVQSRIGTDPVLVIDKIRLDDADIGASPD